MSAYQFLDWFKYLMLPFPSYLKKMGYVREMKALGARRNRCQTAWRPHIERTQALIIKAAEQCNQKHKALIVGSGLLFDIPLEKLCKLFDNVVLVDIVHLWKVHLQASHYPNVRLESLDVTGVVERSFNLDLNQGLTTIQQSQLDYFIGEKFDLAVSVNILSQLPVLPIGYYSRRFRSVKDEQLEAFSRALLENHLDWISSFSGVVGLITDLERLQYRGKELVRRESSLWGITLPPGYKQWFWDLAPSPEIDFCIDIRHLVADYINFPKQVWLERNRKQSTRSGDNKSIKQLRQVDTIQD